MYCSLTSCEPFAPLRHCYFGSRRASTFTYLSPVDLKCSALPDFPVLWPLLTSHSSLLLQISPSVRPHRISRQSFLVYLPNLPTIGYGCLLDFTTFSQLIRYVGLSIRFLFVRLRFRYCFFSPTPHGVKLASCYGVRRQLRPSWTFTTD